MTPKFWLAATASTLLIGAPAYAGAGHHRHAFHLRAGQHDAVVIPAVVGHRAVAHHGPDRDAARFDRCA